MMIISSIASYILLYKYSALFIIVFFSSLIGFIPLNEVILATGAFANLGYINIGLVLFIALFGNILADVFGYFLTYVYGDRILEILHIKKDANFFKVKKYLENYAYGTIYVTKIIGPFGPSVNLVSGLIRIPFKKFLLFDFLGNTTDVLFFVLTGYILGNYWENFISNMWIVGIIAASIFIVYFIVRTKIKSVKLSKKD